MDYELIEDITHADVAVRVKAASYDELFVKSGRALMSEMVENPGDISPLIFKEGVISGDDIELLYFEFLNEILFFKDAESLLLLPEKISFAVINDEYKCSFRLAGEKIIRDKHIFRVDVKAVTMHGLRIYKENDLYIAETVFDV
jgi:SHS2 domain-containing protein